MNGDSFLKSTINQPREKVWRSTSNLQKLKTFGQPENCLLMINDTSPPSAVIGKGWCLPYIGTEGKRE